MYIVDIMDYFIDENNQKVKVFDFKIGDVIWNGFYSDIPEEYLHIELESIDNIENDGYITFNIDTRED